MRGRYLLLLAIGFALVAYELTLWLSHGRHATLTELSICTSAAVVYFGLVHWFTPKKSQLQLFLTMNGLQTAAFTAEKYDGDWGRIFVRFIVGLCLMAVMGALWDAWDESKRRRQADIDQPANSSK